MNTENEYGFIIWQNEWNLVCSEGLFCKQDGDEYEKIGDEGIVDLENIDASPMGCATALYIYACNLKKIDDLPLEEMQKRAMEMQDVKLYAYVRLLKVYMMATLENRDRLIAFKHPVRISCELKAEMNDWEWCQAMGQLIESLKAVAQAAGCSIKDFLDEPNYKLEVEQFNSLQNEQEYYC